MMDVYGYRLVSLTHELNNVEVGLSHLAASDPKAEAPKLNDEGNWAGLAVKTAESLALELDLESTKLQIGTIIKADLFRLPLQHFISDVRQLRIRIEEDLRKKQFLFIEAGMQAFWGEKDAFELGRKFKEAHDDIEHAGNCLAVGEGTACVLHLARAMDAILNQLATRLKIKIGGKDTWGVLLSAMSTKINKMPEATQKQKNRRDRWSEARVHLFHVKEAWRDRPLHAKQSYSSPRAGEVYEAVRVFVNHFSTL
jgi:hypothetical protein